MIRPEPCASMCRPAACDRWKTASRLTREHVVPVLRGVLGGGRAADRAGVVDEDVEPAERRRSPRRPPRRARRGSRSTKSRRIEVHAPAERRGSARRSRAASPRSSSATSAPASASATAAPCPRPRLEPVTRATLPSRRNESRIMRRPPVGAMKRVVSSPMPETRTVTASPARERPVRGLRVGQLLRRAGRDDVARLERHDLAEVVHDERARRTSWSTSTARP